MKDTLLLTEAKTRSETETAFGVTAGHPDIRSPPKELQTSVVARQITPIVIQLRDREVHSAVSVPAQDRIAVALRDNLSNDQEKQFSVSESEVDEVLFHTEKTNQMCWTKIRHAQLLVQASAASASAQQPVVGPHPSQPHPNPPKS